MITLAVPSVQHPFFDRIGTHGFTLRRVETPARVTRALEEAFVGYSYDPAAILQKSFDEIEGYDQMFVLRGIRFET